MAVLGMQGSVPAGVRGLAWGWCDAMPNGAVITFLRALFVLGLRAPCSAAERLMDTDSSCRELARAGVAREPRLAAWSSGSVSSMACSYMRVIVTSYVGKMATSELKTSRK